ncbi:hypothetical protein LIER_15372 [Lithospermum erythrorhizon]|uniref:cellulase n=1 Tax=Lithospermum erythrorhizon TaxID=34254 RepID=A0AAV3Q432_LITER
MYGRDPWGGPLEIAAADSATEDERSRNLQEYDRAALSRQLDETQQGWLLGHGEKMKKKKNCCFVTVIITLIVKYDPRHHNHHPPPDNYTVALHSALKFFNAQRWDAIKFNFPASFAMTMLSWSVIEYSAKYEAAGELQHVKDIIKWGSDYFLKTFNHTADSISQLVAQVGSGDTSNGNTRENDHYCWVRPEDIEYERPVTPCSSCSDLTGIMMVASFFTIHSDFGVSLCISMTDNKDTTLLPVHASLYNGMSIDWDSGTSLRYLKDEVAAGRATWDGSIKIPGTFKIPESCAFLLQAYHRLALSSIDGLVLIIDWINSWSESPDRYVGPQAAGAGRGKTSSLAGYPKGTVPPHRGWDSRDRKVFGQLGICVGIAEETYSAAFLSCWLCLFVLPLETYAILK